jgi:D-alanyl-D-alanine carboxypeptidase/D-alanyl-D-alanine-endopeptidase (penicillin-binding protein 4)
MNKGSSATALSIALTLLLVVFDLPGTTPASWDTGPGTVEAAHTEEGETKTEEETPVASVAGAAERIHSLGYRVSLAENLIRANMPENARWSFSSVALNSSEEITAGNSGAALMTPASLIKLIVTAAILDADVSKRISLDTILAVDGHAKGSMVFGDICIKGNGNALLSEDDLRDAVKALASTGVKVIHGDIIVDDSYFDIRGWKMFGEGPAYATPSALGLDLHTVALDIDRQRGVRATPSAASLKVLHNSGNHVHQVDDLLYRVPDESIRKRFSLRDPALYAGLTLKSLLEGSDITIEGVVRKATMPSTSREFYRIKAKPLSEVVRLTNTYSLNVVSENLLLLLGAETFGPPGTVDKGVNAVELFLEGLGFSSQEANIADGSGLSGENQITTKFMIRFLKRISIKPWFDTFHDSLPMAGMDGTLRGIGYVNERVRVKTGQMNDVYSLAGYLGDEEDERYVFSLIVNVEGADLLSGITEPLLESLAGGAGGI